MSDRKRCPRCNSLCAVKNNGSLYPHKCETMKDYADRIEHEAGAERSLTRQKRVAISNAAERLANYVGSCPEGHHPLDAACPFCADEMAYEALLAAFPNVLRRREPPEGGSIPLGQVERKQ